MMRKHNHEAGFTLMEVMVATVIVGVSFGTICGLLAQTTRTASITERTARATLLAQSQLDTLIAEERIQKGGGKFKSSPDYEWELNVVPKEGGGLDEVTIRVKFNAPGGKRKVTLKTLIADRSVKKKSEQKK